MSKKQAAKYQNTLQKQARGKYSENGLALKLFFFSLVKTTRGVEGRLKNVFEKLD